MNIETQRIPQGKRRDRGGSVKKIFMIIMSIIFLLYLIHAYMSEKKTKQNLPSQEQKIQVK